MSAVFECPRCNRPPSECRCGRAAIRLVNCKTDGTLLIGRDDDCPCCSTLVARLARKAARLFADHTGRLVTIGGAR